MREEKEETKEIGPIYLFIIKGADVVSLIDPKERFKSLNNFGINGFRPRKSHLLFVTQEYFCSLKLQSKTNDLNEFLKKLLEWHFKNG